MNFFSKIFFPKRKISGAIATPIFFFCFFEAFDKLLKRKEWMLYCISPKCKTGNVFNDVMSIFSQEIWYEECHYEIGQIKRIYIINELIVSPYFISSLTLWIFFDEFFSLFFYSQFFCIFECSFEFFWYQRDVDEIFSIQILAHFDQEWDWDFHTIHFFFFSHSNDYTEKKKKSFSILYFGNQSFYDLFHIKSRGCLLNWKKEKIKNKKKIMDFKLIFFVLFLICQVKSDACTFNTTNGSISPTQIMACFNLIPFNSTLRDLTLAEMNKVVDLYSYTDIVKSGSGPPYNINVDLRAELAALAGQTFSNDFLFHLKLNQIFARLGDAHTI